VIEFLTAVPRNSTGKVQKSTLRKHERANQSPAGIG
jgi:acyl-CoA synthetase (AMP-forming)/AMP-acid ligase II